MRRQLTVDGQLYRIEAKLVGNLDKYRYLRIRREQQAFLEIVQLRGDIQHIGFDLLDLPVEAAQVGTGEVICTGDTGDGGDRDDR